MPKGNWGLTLNTITNQMITTASANYLYQAWIQYQGGLKIIGNDLIEKIYTNIYLSMENKVV